MTGCFCTCLTFSLVVYGIFKADVKVIDHGKKEAIARELLASLTPSKVRSETATRKALHKLLDDDAGKQEDSGKLRESFLCRIRQLTLALTHALTSSRGGDYLGRHRSKLVAEGGLCTDRSVGKASAAAAASTDQQPVPCGLGRIVIVAEEHR